MKKYFLQDGKINFGLLKILIFIMMILIISSLTYNYTSLTYNYNQQKLELEKYNQQKLELEKYNQQKLELEKYNQQKLELEKLNSPDNLRARLLTKEVNKPNDYLSSSEVTIEPNITRAPSFFNHTETDGFKITGNIINKATLAVYKDLVITIHYYSKTKTLLESFDFIINEYFNPNSITKFGPYKLYPPNNYDSYELEIIGASSNQK